MKGSEGVPSAVRTRIVPSVAGGSGQPEPRSSRWRPLLVVGPVLILVATWLLSAGGTDPLLVLRYLGVWLALIIIPGVLVWQSLVGRGSPEVEIGAGSVTGVAVFLLSWILATSAGHPRLTWVVVGAVITACALLRARRARRLSTARRARVDTAPRAPLGWWVGISVVALLAIFKVGTSYVLSTPLPPEQVTLSPDIWYYLGIAEQLMRGFPVSDPSLSGATIRYHWFGVAVTAATGQLAGVDLVPALLHFWFVPFVVIWVAATSAATRVVLDVLSDAGAPTRSSIWGPLAALFTVVLPAAVVVSPFPSIGLFSGLNNGSASGAFGGLYLVALGIVVAIALRPDRRAGVWLVFALLIIASTGTKPTVLPICAVGCAVVGLVALVKRQSWLPPALMAGGCLIAYAVGSQIVVGSDAGVQVQPFGMVAADPGYRGLYEPGAAPPANAGGFVLPALAEGRPGAASLLIGYLLLFVLGQSLRLFGLAHLPFVKLLRQPICLWLGGCLVAGYALTFTISHVGLSQQWFAGNVSSLGIVLTTVVVATLLPSRITVPARLLIGGAVVIGTVTGAVLLVLTTPSVAAVGQWPNPAQRLAPYAAVLAAALACLVVRQILIRKNIAGISAVPASVLVVAVLLGSSLPSSTAWLRVEKSPPVTSTWTLSRDRLEAALWLRNNSAPDDVVVSNVFCLPVRYVDRCNHSGVWISALSARRLVLDGWFYLPQNLGQFDGKESAWRLPSPYPDRLRLSLDVVRQPERAAVCSAYVDHGARWVFADKGATPVSSELSRYADLAYDNAEVSVYRLHDLGAYCAGR